MSWTPPHNFRYSRRHVGELVCVLRHVLGTFLLEQIDEVLHFTLNKFLAPKWVPPFVATTSNPRATTKIVGQKVSSMFLPNPCAMAVAMINDAEVRGHCHHSMLRFFAKKLNRLLDRRIFETTPYQPFKFEQGLCRMDCCPILGCFSDEAVNLAERDVRRRDSAFPQDLHVMLSPESLRGRLQAAAYLLVHRFLRLRSAPGLDTTDLLRGLRVLVPAQLRNILPKPFLRDALSLWLNPLLNFCALRP